jgi:RHS repeat-associated protein
MKSVGLYRRAVAALLAVVIFPVVSLGWVQPAAALWGWQAYDSLVRSNSDLGLYWRMDPPNTDEPEGDWGLNSVTATSVGDTDSALAADPGDRGGAFGGSSSLAFTSDDPYTYATVDITAEAWVRTSNLTSTNAMVLSEHASGNTRPIGVQLGVRPDGTPFAQIGLEVATFTSPTVPDFVADGRWHHLALTYDSTATDPILGVSRGFRLYVDGQLSGIMRPTSIVPLFDIAHALSNAEFKVGAPAATLSGHAREAFVGDIDEVAIYHRDLTADEIEANYMAGRGAYGEADLRSKRGPVLDSIGYADDPVNTLTGAFTDEYRDLESPSGVFGLDWIRTYDSGGTAGRPTWGFPYSERLRIVPGGAAELTETTGRVVRFAPNGSGGFLRALEYDGKLSVDGTGWKVVYSNGSRKTFNSSGQVTGAARWNGETVSVTRSSGRVTSLTSSLGPSLTLSYDLSGRLDAVTASDGRVVDYGYDANGFLATTLLPGDTATWTYGNDPVGQVETVTDPTGVVIVTNDYDASGRVVHQWDRNGAESTYSYDPATLTTTITDQVTSTSVELTYDTAGRLVSRSDTAGEVESRSYDDATNLIVETTTRGGGTIATARNADGLPEEISRPGADPVEITYVPDGSNRVQSVTDHRGTKTFTYDGAERTASTITDQLSHTTSFDVNNSTGWVDSVTDADGVTIVFDRDALGRIETITDEYANVTTYGYDAYGHRNSVEQPSGATSSAVYDAAGRPESETAADGGLTEYTYDDAGRVLTVTDGELGVTEYRYDPTTGLLDEMEDPMDRITSYEYDGHGHLKKTTYADASFSSQVVGAMGRLDTTTDEVGRTTTYGYDADGNVTSVEDPAGGVLETFYDPAGRVAWTEDASDRRTTYDYDPITGLLDTETSPAGTITYGYDALGRQQTVIDLRGGETETEYTPGGRVDWIDDPLDRRTDYSYDAAGRLAAVEQPGGLITAYGYDADSNVNLVTTPEGNETATTYDGLGRVLTSTDAAGVVTTNTWTKTGQIKSTSKTGEGTVEYSYNPDGTLDWVDDALNRRTTFEYDDRGLPAKRIDADLNEWLTDYDPAGQLVSETDPLSRATIYTYDDAGRLETKSDPSGRTSTLTWEPDGQLDTRTDVLGTETRTIDFSYDAVGRRSVAVVSGTSPWPLTDTAKLYSYNAAGDLTSESLVSVMGASVRTQSYDYDLAGQRTRLHRADGTTVNYAYDSGGRIDKLDAGEVAADSFAGTTSGPFDDSKWMTTTTAGATTQIINGAGAMEVASSPTSTIKASSLAPSTDDGDTAVTYSFASDATPTEFRLDERTTTGGDRYSLQVVANSPTAAITKTVSGTTTTLATFGVPVGTDPQRARLKVDGTAISAKVWDPDTAEPNTWSAIATDTSITANGKPGLHAATGAGTSNTVTVDEWTHSDPSTDPVTLVDYSWDDDSNLTGEVFADGGTRDWIWTDARLSGLDQDVPGAVHTSSLGYDSSGRINAETVDAATTDYDYDDAGQLLEADPASGPTSSWTYDALGRRATQTVGSDITTYSYDAAGQLTAATPSAGPATGYAYDQAGRRLTETTGSDVTTFTYNASGQLAQTDLPTGELIWRTSDADGASVGFYTDNATTSQYQFYDWDTTSGLSELTAVAGVGFSAGGLHSQTITLTRAPGTPWATAQSTASVDALASDIHYSTIESTATTLAASDSYTPWGQADTTTAQPRLGYRGELTIAGLTHLRARDYDPTTATFTTTDPLDGIDGTTVRNNPYHYTNNNPLNLTDPTGEQPLDSNFACINQQLTDVSTTGIVPDDVHTFFDGVNACEGYQRFTTRPKEIIHQTAGLVMGPGAELFGIVTCLSGEGCGDALVTTAAGLTGAPKTIRRAIPDVPDSQIRQVANAGGVTRVFRVEGPGNARVGIGADGSVSIRGDKTLFLNFGDEARANEFLSQRVANPNTPGSQIKTFDVPDSYVAQLRAQAVPESMASQFPDRPIQVDISKTADSFGLRAEQLEGLVCVIVPGSGQVIC